MRILRQGLASLLDLRAFMAGVVTAVVLATLIFGVWYTRLVKSDQIFPGVTIDGYNLSFLTKQEALAQIAQDRPDTQTSLTVFAGGTVIASSGAQLGLQNNTPQLVDQAYEVGRNESLGQNIQELVTIFTRGQAYTSTKTFDPAKVDEMVTLLVNSTASGPIAPSAKIEGSKVLINPGKAGQSIDPADARNQIMEVAPMMDGDRQITLPMQITGTELSPDAIIASEHRATAYLGQVIEAKADITTVRLTEDDLVAALSLPSGFDGVKLEELMDKIAAQVNRPPQDAKFSFDPTTLKVTEFQPDLDGTTLDREKTKAALTQLMATIEQKTSTEKLHSFSVEVASQPAGVSLEKLNNLGIDERIGFGESFYDHSIPTRIHNVTQASNIVNLTIVRPGEEFSFNKALGDVSAATGFKPAYVIKSGQTVLGDGGGVCQVSTTLFRALLDSGLNITKRRPHSYRVSYYELNREPGFDATVYAGDVDLRFVNDSPGHVLLQFETFPDIKYMRVSIYGTDDGRTTEISGYEKWGFRPPAPTQYIDDPTLAPGKLVQVDWAVSGINTKFTHTVKDRNGNVIRENTYTSNYIPWSAKYRRGI